MRPPWVVLGRGNKRIGRKADQGKAGSGGSRRSARGTMVNEITKDVADRVARQQTGQEVEPVYATRAAKWCSWFELGLPSSLLFSVLILCGFRG